MAVIDTAIAGLVAVPTHVLLAVGLWGLWAVAEGSIHLRGLFQPEQPDRRRAGLTWLQTAFVGAVAPGFLDAVWLRWTTFDESLWPLCYAGSALVAASLWLRIAARITLGRHFSAFVQTCDSHRLVTSGVYARVRHPAYTAFIGFLLGFPLAFGSVTSLVAAVAIGVPALVVRIRQEEAALIAWFGDDYRAYQRTTGLLTPFGP